jgi:hypothetical protein
MRADAIWQSVVNRPDLDFRLQDAETPLNISQRFIAPEN